MEFFLSSGINAGDVPAVPVDITGQNELIFHIDEIFRGLYNALAIGKEDVMNLKRKLLTPALLLASFFGGQALAQEKASLPDAPMPTSTLKIAAPHFDYGAMKSDAFAYKVPAPPPSAGNPFGDGFIGKLAGYVDRHSNESEAPFDFAMEYKLKDRFTLMAGTLSDPRTHGAQSEAARQALRITTGLPDWETVNMRQAMTGVPAYTNQRGGDGFAIGIKIRLGGR